MIYVEDGAGHMNQLAKIETSPLAVPFEAWVDTGRELASRRRNVDWELGQWLVDGEASGHLMQGGFDFISETLGIAPKRLRDIEKAARIPAHMRDASLTIEHHASVADIAEPAAQLELLSQAKAKHWTPEQTRHEAMKSKPRVDRLNDESPLDSFLRHWNRLPRSVRMEAAEMIAASHGDEIEP